MRGLKLEELRHNEQLVLAFWACGQTIKESARYLNLSERTIDYYRGRLKCMLNANSSNEVISRLIMMDDYEVLIALGKKYLVETPRFVASTQGHKSGTIQSDLALARR
jgi:DNA-binding CsgD family transcriptional regulator